MVFPTIDLNLTFDAFLDYTRAGMRRKSFALQQTVIKSYAGGDAAARRSRLLFAARL